MKVTFQIDTPENAKDCYLHCQKNGCLHRDDDKIVIYYTLQMTVFENYAKLALEDMANNPDN